LQEPGLFDINPYVNVGYGFVLRKKETGWRLDFREIKSVYGGDGKPQFYTTHEGIK
jgi:hypothetical protein